MAPFSLLNTLIPPSGVSHSLFLPFTPSVLHPLPSRPSPLGIPIPPGRVLTNLVLAHGRRLRIFEVREEIELMGEDVVELQRKREGKISVTAQEGGGDGEFEIGGGGGAQGIIKEEAAPPKSLRLHHVLSYTLHGTVTGLGAIKTIATREDGLSRLVVSYEEAKMAILEFNDQTNSLQTVSLHTYERTPQVAQGDLTGYVPLLRVDPDSRCAILLLPNNSMAVLPILGDGADDVDFEMEEGGKDRREVPYAPSYAVELSVLDPRIRNVQDLCFLPGFNSPTIAILYQTQQSWANRDSEPLPFTLSFHTLDPHSPSPSYPLIASIPNLPSGSLSLLPCPPHISGCLLTTPNALIHIDPSGNTLTTAVNLYHSIEVAPTFSGRRPTPELTGLRLEGSRVVFLEGGRKALLVMKEGDVRELAFEKEGRMLVGIQVGKEAVGRTARPGGQIARLEKMSGKGAAGGKEGEVIFVGGTGGEGVLLRVGREGGGEAVKVETFLREEEEEDGMDIEDDLYGPSTTSVKREASAFGVVGSAGAQAGSGSGSGSLRIEVCDTLKDHGAILDLAFGTTPPGTESINEPQLVAIAGAGHTASFNYFHRDMPALKKRRINSLAGSRGLWSLRVPIPQSGRHLTNGAAAAAALRVPDKDTVLVVDDNHESGHSKIFTLVGTRGEPLIVRRIPAATVSAAEFFQKTCLVHVTTASVSVVEGDGRERQSIKTTHSRFKSATISDPYVLAQREDGSIALFVGDTMKGTLSEVQVPLSNDNQTSCVASSIYTDKSGIFTARKVPSTSTSTASSSKPKADDEDAMEDESDLYGPSDVSVKVEEPEMMTTAEGVTSSVESMMDAGKGTQWLCLTFGSGLFEIRSLPNLEVMFSVESLGRFPTVLSDETEEVGTIDEEASTSSSLPLHQLLIAPIGVHSPRPHLLLLTSTGNLIIYEATPIFPSSSSSSSSDPLPPSRSSLAVRFVKIISRAVRPPDDPEDPEPPIPWSLVPFAGLRGLTGVFLTGDLPFWILRDETAPVMLYGVDERMVHAFEPTTMWGKEDQYLLTTEEGPNLVAFPRDIEITQPLPHRRTTAGRTYTHVVFDPPTRHMVAVGLHETPFEIFDEDDNRVEHKSHDPLLLPLQERSSLELLSFETGEVIDGYVFSDNELVLGIKSVNLESKSSPSGRKDYVAVGTGITRGEDLMVRGATYIFEVVEVVPQPGRPQSKHKLKLLCHDPCKGAVTAISDINGYLVSATAQKMHIRAFEHDERLLGLAFLDVSIYVTSIRTLKNLLLIGDVEKSVWFAVFQEDPFKLVMLGKDYRRQHVVSADFLVSEGKVGFVVSDRVGDLRMLEYNPGHVDAEAGQKLIYRTEYHTGTENSSVLTIARRTTEAELIAPQSELVMSGVDGSISHLIAVTEPVFKRLQLLQGQLLRSVQHVSGLNPRAFRTVRNDQVSRPLTKGILDGDLLFGTFDMLPRGKQEEITKQIGSSVDVLLDDLEELRSVW